VPPDDLPRWTRRSGRNHIKSAFYGNLKFAFPEGQPDKGKLVFEKDGGWSCRA
jgi:hypothetical protein